MGQENGVAVRLGGPLGSLAARRGVAALAALLSVTTAAGAVRLLPWWLDERVPSGAAMVFARLLAASAVEAACLLGVPIGFALAAEAFHDRGEAMACLLVGASPARIALLALPVALPGAIAGACSGGWASSAAASPARTLVALIDAARDACDGDLRAVADAPGLGVAFLCPQHGESRLAWVEGDRSVALLSTASLDAARGEVRAGPTTLALRGPPEVHVEVREARVTARSLGSTRARGLFVSRPDESSRPGGRALAVAGAALVGAWTCATALLGRRGARGSGSLAVALATGAAAGLGPLGWVSVVERRAAPPIALAATPLIAALTPLAVLTVFEALRWRDDARSRRIAGPGAR